MVLTGGLIALSVTVAFMLALRPVAFEIGLADEPGGRKRHGARVPVVGGIAMVTGLAFGSTVVAPPDFWSVAMPGIWLLAAVGAIDDRLDLPPAVRLLAQAIAAMLVVFGAGVVAVELGAPLFFSVSLGMLGPLFSVLLIMTLVNGFNLIDGIDGLAGGVALVSLAALAVIGIGTPAVFSVIVLLAMTVLGFLLFNMPLQLNRHLRVFMGDAGSTVLGFALACTGIALTQGAAAQAAPVIVLWVLAVPIYEVLSAAWRRVKDGRSPWAPDDKHLHHSLLARGISPRRTLAFLLLLAVAFAGIGVAGHWIGLPDGVMFAGWVAAGVAYYRITWRPTPVALWVRSWKECDAPDETFIEAMARAGQSERSQ